MTRSVVVEPQSLTLVEVPRPNLTDEEIRYAVKKLQREPNAVEWAMLEAQWSEHCSYKSSKPLLKQLPSKGPRVLVGPGFDAGAIDIGDGWVVSLHIESHNHPSAIDPYGGAATGVGGVVRDILSLGTRPIALLDPLRFGSIESLHTRWLFDNVVRGIADYGNCIGVPTVGGEVEFDPSFERNCLVDVVCAGLGRRDRLVLGEARNPGDLVYLVGGRTGRDGIRGASFASKTLTDKSDMERSAVQVPDPFTKKLIIEAILEAVEANIIQGMKDLGGGGLTCGLSEIAAKAGTGIEVDLDKVLTREPDMQPAEIMISESQERMLLLIREKDETRLVRILEKWELGYAKIGRVTKDGLLIIRQGNEIVAKAPAKFVAEAPLAPRSSRRPLYLDALAEVPEPAIPEDLGQILVALLSSPNIASKEWIYRQYDHEVGIRTIVKPGEADSALLRLPNNRSLALTTGGNSKQCYVDPYWGTVGVVSEALCNLVVAGAEPVAVVDHLQFGDPGNPEVYWTFKEAIRAISNYLKAVDVPCIGGKVSFYNEDSMNRKAIKPSPVIAALGLVEQKTSKILQALREEGDDLIIVGNTSDEMGGSEYYEHIHNLTGGQVSRVNLKKEKILLRSLLRIQRSGRVESAHDISKGGLAAALAEMSVQGRKGATVDLDRVPNKTSRMDNLLFSETRSRLVLETKPRNTARMVSSFKRLGIPAAKIGTVTDNGVEFLSNSQPIITIPLAEASRAWSETIPRAMEATL
ncbi:phosphoribosylformylglycinamidine synthase subunit PurL [Candidatus Bathyarchaeota archaeon]|nr:MAG: phosphoribosylformylglycinamidine synthase subunit PurL [Candidatus Bathyarchaeota archaeon]